MCVIIVTGIDLNKLILSQGNHISANPKEILKMISMKESKLEKPTRQSKHKCTASVYFTVKSIATKKSGYWLI